MRLFERIFQMVEILDDVRRFDTRVSFYRPYGRRKPVLGPRRRWRTS